MKKKKFVAVLLCTAMAVTMLAGCGSTSTVSQSQTQEKATESDAVDEVQKSEETDEVEQVTLKVGGWPAVEGTALDRWNAVKEQFEKDNPNITIVPDTFGYDLQIFQAQAAAGTLPDLLPEIPATEISLLLSGDYIADMTDALDRAGYTDKLNEAIIEQISSDGKIYCLPANVYAMGLMYDASLMREAGLMNEDGTPVLPETWEDLAEMAVQIKEKTGAAGFAMATINNQGGWMFVPIAWSYGVDFMEQDEDGKWQATFNTQETVDALQFIKELKWKYDVFSEDVLIDYGTCASKLATGQMGITPMAPDMANSLAKKEMPLENIGIMPMPSGPAKRVALSGGGRFCMTAGVTEAQKDAAIKWLEAMGYGYQLTEDAKATVEEDLQWRLSNNVPIGMKTMSVFNDSAEVSQYKNQLYEDNCNIIIEQVQAYNDILLTTDIEYHLEEPIECQKLYGILDGCVQEVLTNENADCAALIEEAAKEFQVILDQAE
ncbi:MAG: extracellular solute-binding protein [Lachnospiraceae bacterium]|nr:extracellular solute-binding protein [Lachnospiraceae bacterium]